MTNKNKKRKEKVNLRVFRQLMLHCGISPGKQETHAQDDTMFLSAADMSSAMHSMLQNSKHTLQMQSNGLKQKMCEGVLLQILVDKVFVGVYFMFVLFFHFVLTHSFIN